MKEKTVSHRRGDQPRVPVRLRINNEPAELLVSPRETLLETLRRLEHTEVKNGCGTGECGVCAVLLHGTPVNACLVLTVQCNDAAITTVAGMGNLLAPSRLQTALAADGAVQCGFCTPGLICAITPLVERGDVTEEDVRRTMDGILCRCTGYVKPVEAILSCCGSAVAEPQNVDSKLHRTVGHRVPKRDSLAMACGTALYCDDDIHVGALVLKAVPSTLSHAQVKEIDTSAALAMDGVAHIITCFDVSGSPTAEPGMFPDTAGGDNCLLTSRPRHVGDRIAAVIASDEETAALACAALRITYDPLPAVFSVEEALEPGAPEVDRTPADKAKPKNVVAELSYDQGTPESALEHAEVKVRCTVKTSACNAAFAEPFSCITWLDVNGRVVVRTSTQVPYFVRWVVSSVCGVPISSIQVIRPCIGGGFGAKQDVFVEPLCTLATLRTGKPVRYVYSRHEVFRAGRHRHPSTISVEASATDGRVDALGMHVTLNTGAYRCHAGGVLLSAASRPLPMYPWRHIQFRGRSVATNLPPSAGIRGYGAPQSFFALESAIDELALRTGCDPLEFRRRNVIREGDSLEVVRALERGDEPCPPTLRGSSLDRCLDLGAEIFGWKEKRNRVNDGGRKRLGIGMAVAMQAPTSVHLMLSSATMKLDEDGSFTLLSGAADIGTGADTALSQIAAEVLSVPSQRIIVATGNTDLAPFDSGAYSSSTTWNAGTAAYRAAQAVKVQLIETAARISGRFPDTLRLENGCVLSDDNEVCLPYGEIAMTAIHNRALRQITASASHAPRRVPPSFNAHFAEVEVDTHTGFIRVVSYLATVDCGVPVNPTLVEGQMHGAIAMGIGATLTEEIQFSGDGIMRNPNFSDYRVMRSVDMPPIRVVLVPSNPPGVPFGAKSVGEIGVMGPMPAIANAVAHATGVRLTEAPFTPWRVLEALEASRSE